MLRLLPLLGVVGAVLAFLLLPWWAVLLVVLLVVLLAGGAVKLFAGRSLRKALEVPFQMKSRVLRGFRLEPAPSAIELAQT